MAIRLDKALQRSRVFLGFIFAPVYFVFSRPTIPLIIIGTCVAICGLVIRGWASGHLRKVQYLDVSGPYAYTRNPLYFGSFLIAVGFAVASGVWWLGLLLILCFLSIYLPVINVERNELESGQGHEYREYATAVPLFIPRLRAWKKSGRSFDFQLYLKNGEYNASIGVLLVDLVLLIKACFID